MVLRFGVIRDKWGEKLNKAFKHKFNMSYSKSFEKQVFNLRELLLGKISYNKWKTEYEKTKKSYEIVFESDNYKEFTKQMSEFFEDDELVKKRLSHEKKHAKINKKYGIKSKFILKSYKREGKTRYRPSVLDADKEDKKEGWSKKRLWQYNYEQTSIEDGSDNDNKLKKMLLEIKVDVFI